MAAFADSDSAFCLAPHHRPADDTHIRRCRPSCKERVVFPVQRVILCAIALYAPTASALCVSTGAARTRTSGPRPVFVRSSAAPVASHRALTQLSDDAQYQAKIDEATRENKVVIIKFHASWCRACKAMAPKYQRVAEDWPELEFCEILFDNNKKLCKSLGIKILPYVEVIGGTLGKVEGFSCGPSKISRLQERLEVHGGCEEIPCTDVSELLPAEI
eukprot:CAMPEP_0119377788 /NCGR_PEP_ID=MMETSP1334-20130426/46628_1 /TAXON_ID=127549 /ORGANISM="Calcidiscus leptoporus, Strain RCC1130" /LENGTH=216 /DNA_ID=CAMNT_0007396811 /DNA_START=11 /DNA_END=661 /DNA_ORIENTATION=-